MTFLCHFNYFPNIPFYDIHPLLASLATSEHSTDVFKEHTTVNSQSNPECY